MTTGKKLAYSFLAAMVPMLLFAYSTGPDPRHTAAPGDDPLACSTAGCHTGLAKGGPLNAAGGRVSVTFSNGSFYIPGQAVTITVSVTDPVNTWHGFQMSARLENNLANGQAGSFRTVPGTFVLCDDGTISGFIRRGNACPTNAPVEFIEHDQPIQGTWTFTWIPPATDSGPVDFYVAGNAVNNNAQADAGDHVYTNHYVLRPQSACAQPVPVITGVRRIEGWGDGTTFSSGSWVEITGSNLAQPTGSWLDADFNNGSARTSLGGSSVSINGKPGFISYISPVQINLQAPADPSTGALPITVTNCAGTSNPVNGPNLQKIAMAPGLLAPPTNISPYFTAGGKQYLVATFGFQYLFVGNANSQAVADGIGNLFVPAKPKDSILLYAIGLGDTSPANTPGVIASGQEVLNAPVTVNFGSTPATVNRVAMYPTFVGLYYIIVTVPATLADGDYQINVTVNGQPMQTPSPLFLTVHH